MHAFIHYIKAEKFYFKHYGGPISMGRDAMPEGLVNPRRDASPQGLVIPAEITKIVISLST